MGLFTIFRKTKMNIEKTIEFKARGHNREITLSLSHDFRDWVVGVLVVPVTDVCGSKCFMVSVHLLCVTFHVEYWRWAKNES